MNSLVWLNSSGLWALAGLAAVAVLYLFYRRYKPLPATGLFLWGAPRRDAAGGRKTRAPLLSRSFLFDLLAALFFALAIAGPAVRTDASRPAVVILDDSFAMRSRGSRDEAAAKAEAALAGSARAAVILAGEKPRVSSGMGIPPAEAAKRLARYSPAARAADLPAAAVLAGQLYGDKLDVHVITNREPPELSPGAGGSLTVEIVRGAGDNFALGRIWRTPVEGGGERLIATLRNYSQARRDAVVRVKRHGGGDVLSGAMSLPPNGEAFFEAALTGVEASALVVAVDGGDNGDAIADDSLAFVPPSPDDSLVFGFEGVKPEARRFFSLALTAAGCVAATPGVTPDLLVTGGSESRGGVLTLELSPEGTPGIFLPPIVVDSTGGLCRDVDLSSIPWIAAARDIPANVREAYVLAGDIPLYWRSSLRRTHLNLVPERSQLVREPTWPALMANLAAEARRLKAGLRKTVCLPGETVAYNADRPDGGRILADAHGAVAARALGGVLRAPEQPGLYRLLDADKDVGSVAVLPDYGDASDTTLLAEAASSIRLDGPAADAAEGALDLTLPALALALLFLALNWRRNAGGNP